MPILINDNTARVQYTATAGQTVFIVPYEFFETGDLKVYNGDTLLTYNVSPSSASQYSVAGAGVTGGGSVTLGAPGATLSDIITIVRDIPIKRVTDFPNAGPFNIQALNAELDKITAVQQNLETDFDNRALRLSEFDTPNTLSAIPNKAARQNKLLGFDLQGQPVAYDTASLATLVAYATAFADTFTGDGSDTTFTLSGDPAVLANLDVSINGVTQVPLVDYTLSGTTLTTTTAVPNGAVMLVKYKEGLPNYSGDAQDVRYNAGFSGAVQQSVESKLAQYVSVKDFGAVGDGVTDDTAAINAGANALQALGGGTLGFPRGDYFIGANTITIPKYVEVDAAADAVIIQSAAASGTAMVIQGRPFSETFRRSRIHKLPSIQKGNASGQPAWNAGTDTSSIGLHIDGCSDDTFFLRAVAYFYNGVLMNSDFPAPAPNDTLCVNNTVNLGNIRNCYKGLWLENGANSNTFIQGVINVDNAWITAGTTHITLKGAESNTNTFVGTNLEGPSNVNLKAVEVESIANLFNNCRIEKLTAGALRFTSTSNTNIWIGGSDKASSVSQGYFDAVVSDSGFGNTFQWGGTYSGRHVTIDNGAGTDRQGIGFSSGSFPTAWISAYAANRLWLKGTTAALLQGVRYQGCMNQEKLTITSGTNWLNQNANIIVANYAAPQSISTFGNVGALSDVNALATIMDLNGNITLVHTASPASGDAKFVLKAGVNLLLTANQPVQFMSHDGNWYQL